MLTLKNSISLFFLSHNYLLAKCVLLTGCDSFSNLVLELDLVMFISCSMINFDVSRFHPGYTSTKLHHQKKYSVIC